MMAPYIRNRLTYIWLLLSILTVISWWFGTGNNAQSREANVLITLVVLLIALVKTRFVIRNYMELRSAPSWLQLTCDAWLLCFFGLVLCFYWFGV
jgi:hypothetical protein